MNKGFFYMLFLAQQAYFLTCCLSVEEDVELME